MKKYFLGAFIMLMALKPAVGIALVSVFAEGLQTAAAAMAHGNQSIKVDPHTSFAPPMPPLIPIDQADQPKHSQNKQQDQSISFEDRVMAVIEKKHLHEEEQIENQRKLAEAEATKRAEKAGIEMFDEEFNKKFPTKR